MAPCCPWTEVVQPSDSCGLPGVLGRIAPAQGVRQDSAARRGTPAAFPAPAAAGVRGSPGLRGAGGLCQGGRCRPSPGPARFTRRTASGSERFADRARNAGVRPTFLNLHGGLPKGPGDEQHAQALRRYGPIRICIAGHLQVGSGALRPYVSLRSACEMSPKGWQMRFHATDGMHLARRVVRDRNSLKDARPRWSASRICRRHAGAGRSRRCGASGLHTRRSEDRCRGRAGRGAGCSPSDAGRADGWRCGSWGSSRRRVEPGPAGLISLIRWASAGARLPSADTCACVPVTWALPGNNGYRSSAIAGLPTTLSRPGRGATRPTCAGSLERSRPSAVSPSGPAPPWSNSASPSVKTTPSVSSGRACQGVPVSGGTPRSRWARGPR